MKTIEEYKNGSHYMIVIEPVNGGRIHTGNYIELNGKMFSVTTVRKYVDGKTTVTALCHGQTEQRKFLYKGKEYTTPERIIPVRECQ